MLPGVWSVEKFKSKSSKIFSPRSGSLRAIDIALERAHLFDPKSEAGVNALIDLVKAISDWRAMKAEKGKVSGRAPAVEALLDQVTTACEEAYRRKVAAANMTAPFVHNTTLQNHSPQAAMKIGQQQFGQMLKPVPPQAARPPGIPAPPVPAPSMTRTAAEDRLFDHIAQEMLKRRQQVMAFDDGDLFEDLDPRQRGRLTANWMLSVSDAVTDEVAARAEAVRIIGAMLGKNLNVIKNLLSSNVEVVVVSRNEAMTVLREFAELGSRTTHDSRGWTTVRGVGNQVNTSLSNTAIEWHELEELRDSGKKAASIVAIDPNKGRVYTAITEENLLGGSPKAGVGGCYAPGYSTTTHEFAHSIHAYGLPDADHAKIEQAYKLRLLQPETEEWVDGPRKVGTATCYAAQTVNEYFAQLSNAWLGVNIGKDPYTHEPRNNGRQWVLDHEPRMVSEVLERVYGNTIFEDLNPSVIIKS